MQRNWLRMHSAAVFETRSSNRYYKEKGHISRQIVGRRAPSSPGRGDRLDYWRPCSGLCEAECSQLPTYATAYLPCGYTRSSIITRAISVAARLTEMLVVLDTVVNPEPGGALTGIVMGGGGGGEGGEGGGDGGGGGNPLNTGFSGLSKVP